MMKPQIWLFVLLLTLGNHMAAQPLVINWQNCYGNEEDQVVRDIVFTGDGYIMAGETGYYPRLYLLKTDLEGNLIWEKEYYGPRHGEAAFRIFPAEQGNYFVVATASSSSGDITYDPYPDPGSNNAWILKIDSNGNKLWDKIFGGNCLEKGKSGLRTSDTAVIFVGFTCSNDGDVSHYYGADDGWMIKVDKQGNKMWDFTIGNNWFDRMTEVTETSDKSLLVGGFSYYGENGNISCNGFNPYDGVQSVLFKLDSAGNYLWHRCYGGSSHEALAVIVETDDGYLLGISTSSSDGDVAGTGYHPGYDNVGNPTFDIWLVKTDFEGNIVWSKCYGGYYEEVPNRIFRMDDGGFLVFGTTQSYDGDVVGNHSMGYPNSDIWVFKVSSTGTLEWQQCIGGNTSEYLRTAIERVGTNKYVIATTAGGVSSGQITCLAGTLDFQIWLIEVTDTTVGLAENENDMPLLKLYPNPAALSAWVELPEKDIQVSMQVQLIGPTGGRLYEAPAKGRFHQIALEPYPAGLYLVRLWDGERWRVQKLVKQ
ncbi:MAG: T9SS type A sorting domain-containing protein [Bacteroidales bacterium]|nr:T9SS type A sorting domain-containing protein [Bacteroidales bacterium]